MKIDGYEYDDPVPIAVFANAVKPTRTVDCVRKWRNTGIVNRLTRLRVRCEMTFLPTGGLGVSMRQYDAFIASLNEKP